MKPFVVSPEVSFPSNAATSTFAYLGTRGSGKTFAAGVMAEAFLEQHVQVVVVDLVGTWWALRLNHDGKRPGFDIPVFGGIHGDIPLAPTAGGLVASLIAERGMSMVLDISDFTIGQQRRFVTDLAHDVFQLKKRNPSPVHFIFEEGHEVFPQFVDGAAAPLVGATTRMWKIGRNYGIGGTIISQRAAEVNKSALNLTDRIITGQLKAPEDIKRIDGWANSNGVSDAMVKELPKLPKGTLIVWGETGAVRTVFKPKLTFDASRTPDGTISRKRLAPIDLETVKRAMAASVEEAQANDPKALRARITELEKKLHEVPAAAPGKTIEKPVVKEADLKRIEKLVQHVERTQNHLGVLLGEALGAVRQAGEAMVAKYEPARVALNAELKALTTAVHLVGGRISVPVTVNVMEKPRDAERLTQEASYTRQMQQSGGVEHIPDKCQRMLAALRHGEAMGMKTMPFKSVALIAGVAPTSGTTSNRKGLLTKGGYMTTHGDQVQLTDKGRAYPIDVEMPPTEPKALLAYWKREIGTEKIATMLDVVVTRGQATSEELAEAAGMEMSGTFSNYKGELTRRGLIIKQGNAYVPAEAFTR